MRERSIFSIGDKVKYYFRYGNYLLIQTGTVFIIYNSTMFPNKLKYGVQRDSNKFHDFGYVEDFKKIKE